jgi:predicted flap endonuclease-1-like 5' DNA nuclease
MKKISAFLFTIVLVISFTACGGEKKAKAPAEESVNSATVEVATEPEPVAPSLSPAEMLKNFQTYAKEYREAFNGLPRTVTKYSQLAAQSQKNVTEMEKIKGGLNARQQQDYQQALEIVIKVNRGGK